MFAPKDRGELTIRLGADGTDADLITRLAVGACGGQGPEADRVAQRLRASLPGYVAAIVRHETRVDGRVRTDQA